MTSESDVKKAVQVAMEKFGGINVVVNCAGIIGMSGKTLTENGPYPVEEFQRTLQVATELCIAKSAHETMLRLFSRNSLKWKSLSIGLD